VTYYVLFFIHLASRQVHIAGVTPHPDETWMVQVARNVTMEEWGFLVWLKILAASTPLKWLRLGVYWTAR